MPITVKKTTPQEGNRGGQHFDAGAQRAQGQAEAELWSRDPEPLGLDLDRLLRFGSASHANSDSMCLFAEPVMVGRRRCVGKRRNERRDKTKSRDLRIPQFPLP